jgi:hypothetical protein
MISFNPLNWFRSPEPPPTPSGFKSVTIGDLIQDQLQENDEEHPGMEEAMEERYEETDLDEEIDQTAAERLEGLDEADFIPEEDFVEMQDDLDSEF